MANVETGMSFITEGALVGHLCVTYNHQTRLFSASFVQSDGTFFQLFQDEIMTIEEFVQLKEHVETNRIQVLEDPASPLLYIITPETRLTFENIFGLTSCHHVRHLMQLGMQKLMEENALVFK